ncbi:hypothetical protein [Bacillus songklensis]
MEGVNYSRRQRGYRAREKEELINAIVKLHIRVYGRNGWLKTRVGFTGTKEMLESILQFLKSYGIGQNVNSIYEKQGCYDLYISSVKEAQSMFSYLYKYGNIKLNRKYEKFSSLMI